MNAQQWAFTELDLRRQEEAYSKKTADDLVSWAEEQDRRAAA